MAIIEAMNHFTVLTEDLPATRDFYIDLMGLTEGPRPAFKFPGLWLYAGGQPIVHIIAGRKMPDDPAGVLDHMAFTAHDLPTTAAKLKQRGIEYDLRRLPMPGNEQWQLFCRDPNGAVVELDFDPSEKAPPDHKAA
jgi:catechol 2,3-dioxygenase-like lactoylglutathione lyase family enzyme